MSTGAMLVFSGLKLASVAENGLDGVGREVGRSDYDVAKRDCSKKYQFENENEKWERKMKFKIEKK